MRQSQIYIVVNVVAPCRAFDRNFAWEVQNTHGPCWERSSKKIPLSAKSVWFNVAYDYTVAGWGAYC